MYSLVSLFSGAGGLDLGLEEAGFKVQLCVENDLICRNTLHLNRPRWRLSNPGDIFKLKPTDILKQSGLKKGELDLLAGGPPCQPFSKASYWHRGDSLRLKDPRAKTLNSYMKIVEGLLPRTILLENVDGIRFANKDEGLNFLLSNFKKINKKYSTHYDPVILAINAAEYGVPQLRKRMILIAARDGSKIELPKPSHGPNGSTPYVTAWNAIGDLNKNNYDRELTLKGRWGDILPSIPEGNNYQWHTNRGGGKPIFGFRCRYWSFLLKLAKDKPSWTIQASPGPSTGPFHWNNRLLSTRELARIQTFPDDFNFSGTKREAHHQIGNAVPPLIGEFIGRLIISQILGGKHSVKNLFYMIKKNKNCPPAEPILDVPKKYHSLIGKYPAHPGTGKGPRALLLSRIKNSIL